MTLPKCTIIMPIYNGATTLPETFRSLVAHRRFIGEVIAIDDGSQDDSCSIALNFLKTLRCPYRLIRHKRSRGLAYAYNEGIKIAKSALIVTLHQDVVLDRDALAQLLAPLANQKRVVATYHIVDHPMALWRQYNFWQKCLFARLVGKRFCGLDGKFDGFKRTALLQIGLFDGQAFRRAGEDGDIIRKLQKIGEIKATEAKIVHLHNRDPKFGVKQYIYKQAQYSEAQGALLRHYPPVSFGEFVRAFFRELLLLGLLVPYIRILAAIALVFYAFFYTKNVFLYDWRDWRIIILPFVNIYLCFVSFYFSAKGMITGRQNV